jgi:hypothetical protein
MVLKFQYKNLHRTERLCAARWWQRGLVLGRHRYRALPIFHPA